MKGSFDNLLGESHEDQWFNTENIHPCSIKDFTILAKKVGFTINETYDVKKNQRFLFPKTPSGLKSKSSWRILTKASSSNS